MTIQFNTDKNIEGKEKLEAYTNSLITTQLARFQEHITRIEVHLSDENGGKVGQNDKRCLIEARMENNQPIAVTSFANTIEKSVNESLDKLKSSMDTILGKKKNH